MPYIEGPKMDWTVKQIVEMEIEMWEYPGMWACNACTEKNARRWLPGVGILGLTNMFHGILQMKSLPLMS